MAKVAIIYCGQYVNSGFGCPGEWRCHKAAALGEGNFQEPSQIIFWIKCECPGHTILSNTKMAMKLAEIKPDAIYLSSCMVNSWPKCPYFDLNELEQKLKESFQLPIIKGTHSYK